MCTPSDVVPLVHKLCCYSDVAVILKTVHCSNCVNNGFTWNLVYLVLFTTHESHCRCVYETRLELFLVGSGAFIYEQFNVDPRQNLKTVHNVFILNSRDYICCLFSFSVLFYTHVQCVAYLKKHAHLISGRPKWWGDIIIVCKSDVE